MESNQSLTALVYPFNTLSNWRLLTSVMAFLFKYSLLLSVSGLPLSLDQISAPDARALLAIRYP